MRIFRLFRAALRKCRARDSRDFPYTRSAAVGLRKSIRLTPAGIFSFFSRAIIASARRLRGSASLEADDRAFHAAQTSTSRADSSKLIPCLSAILRDPTDIFWQTVVDLREDYFRDFVRMKRAQLFLKRCLSIFVQFEKDQRFICRFDFASPAIDGLNWRQNVRAGGEPFAYELIRNSPRRFGIRKRAQSEQNFFSHALATRLSRDPSTPLRSARDDRRSAGKSSRRRGRYRHGKSPQLARA